MIYLIQLDLILPYLLTFLAETLEHVLWLTEPYDPNYVQCWRHWLILWGVTL